ncbi:MAG: hypothetical protein M1832_006047 [Thelocarpon impressellum]|nr:MAG: hypothetical protein M1832_006047 [Thelocarpon impressellum]
MALAQLRESIVNNWTLANYAKQYGLNDRIRFQEGFSMEGKGSTKVHADVLEAYVAALILQSPEDGFAIAEAWLNELWAPKLQETDLVPELNPQAKSELARMIMGKNIKVEYVDARKPEISTQEKGKTNFFVDVYLTGWGWQYQLLGSGTGWSKGQAGNRAAMAAMANEPLISEVAAAKQAFDTAVRRERELEIVAAAQQ